MINKFKFVHTIALALIFQWFVIVNTADRAQNIVETLVIVDKEFGELFDFDYQKIADYLTVYFWDINSRYKSLWSVDISLKVIDLMIIKSKRDQPFVENARNADGITYYETIFNLFRPWLYQNRDKLTKHDLAFLITNSQGENEYGIATVKGACTIDDGEELGAVVVYDRGLLKSMGVAAHEIGHSLGSEHDDIEGCPTGFLMDPTTQNNYFFFSSCTDKSISNYVNSVNASCLRTTDAEKRTTIDTYFSTPKAGTMFEVCKKRYGPKAKIDKRDEANCKLMLCQSLDENHQYVTNYLIETVENIQCVADDKPGRCFRGRCRPESKLLQHVASGLCAKPKSQFGSSGAVVMVKCPTSRQVTPLDTLEIIDTDDVFGHLLASPYTAHGNKESGDKCLYIGDGDDDAVWTEECDVDELMQIWNFNPVDKKGNQFNLVNESSGKCMQPMPNSKNSLIGSATCSPTDKNLIWRWFDGQ